MSEEACFYWDFCKGCFPHAVMQTTQKGRTWVSHKTPCGQSGRSSCGTGGGPHGQSQIINLVNGVVTVALRPRTPPMIGSTRAGPSSMNGFKRTPVAGRPTASLPVRAPFTSTARTWQALKFLPREGSPAGDWFAPDTQRVVTVYGYTCHDTTGLYGLLICGGRARGCITPATSWRSDLAIWCRT